MFCPLVLLLFPVSLTLPLEVLPWQHQEMLSAVHHFRAADEVWGDLLPKVITALFLLNINEKVISAATLL